MKGKQKHENKIHLPAQCALNAIHLKPKCTALIIQSAANKREQRESERERTGKINAFKEKLRIIAGSVLKIKSTTILHKQIQKSKAKKSKKKKTIEKTWKLYKFP